MHNSKGFISALVIIIIFALLGAGAFVTLKYNGAKFIAPAPQPEPEPMPAPVPPPEPVPPVSGGNEMPVIDSVSPSSATVGSVIKIKGKHFNGFEGDLYAWIENAKGVRGLLRGMRGSSVTELDVSLDPSLCRNDTFYSGKECTAWLTLIPGEYKIYVMPWGKKSNVVAFTIKPFPKGALSETALKYKLESIFGRAVFCGPPVAGSGYDDTLIAQFPEVQSDQQEFSAILGHLNMSTKSDWSRDEKLLIMQEHNQLSGIAIDRFENGKSSFSIHARNSGGEFVYEGTISIDGDIVLNKKTAYNYGCPICLAGGTMIDTPTGPRRITELTEGMPVWTQTRAGERVRGSVVAAAHVNVGSGHNFIKLTLDDGRVVWASSGHPTYDGRIIGNLKTGDRYDGSYIKSLDQVPNTDGVTYDILPSGDTGFYWANGILLGSTLKR